MIKYRRIRGYKYQLTAPYSIDVDIFPLHRIETPFFALSTGGNLLVKSLYAWDGCSGPTFDTEDSMEGSLIHDVLYQGIREGFISAKYKDYTDKLFHKTLLKNGMNKIRAYYFYLGVKWFGKYALKQRED